MKTSTIKADFILILAAAIWGFSFVAQRAGMNYIGPFLFNGIRFALGALSLVPLILWTKKKNGFAVHEKELPKKVVMRYGLIIGSVLFCGASLQQIGMVYTSAGKAGFITGLYVVLVPLAGLFWRQSVHIGTWLGVVVATAGLYFISVTDTFTIESGDLWVLASALFWTAHVHVISWLSQEMDALLIAFLQFIVCSILSLLSAFFLEAIIWASIWDAAIPIFYGGVFSAGIAYTLQVIAQRDAPAAHAAIILSIEGVFAVIGGWLLLSEVLSRRSLIGCGLMFAGMIFSQVHILYGKRIKAV